MRFSRYALIWLFISHPTTRLFPCVRIADESSFFNLAAACSPTLTRSTIGRLGLNRRVRDGYGCSPQAHRHQKYFELLTTQQRNTHPLLVHFHRKEVIQPHLPIRLPCYDFTPVTGPAFDSSLLAVGPLASGVSGSHGVTGGVYKTRERIHRGILIRDY